MSAFSDFGNYCRQHRILSNGFYYILFVIGILSLFIAVPLGGGIMLGTWICYKDDEGKPYG